MNRVRWIAVAAALAPVACADDTPGRVASVAIAGLLPSTHGTAQQPKAPNAGSAAAASEMADFFRQVGDQIYEDCIFELSQEQLEVQHERALSLGARLLLDRADAEEEPLRVYADLAGHPFCIFVRADDSPPRRD